VCRWQRFRIEDTALRSDCQHLPDRLQPAPYLPFRIAFVEQLRYHPLDGLAVQPPLRRFAASLLGPARQIFPGQLVVLPVETDPGDQVGHVLLVAESQIEAADVLDSQRMEVVFDRTLTARARGT
jgi:hypothetical protein